VGATTVTGRLETGIDCASTSSILLLVSDEVFQYVMFIHEGKIESEKEGVVVGSPKSSAASAVIIPVVDALERFQLTENGVSADSFSKVDVMVLVKAISLPQDSTSCMQLAVSARQ